MPVSSRRFSATHEYGEGVAERSDVVLEDEMKRLRGKLSHGSVIVDEALAEEVVDDVWPVFVESVSADSDVQPDGCHSMRTSLRPEPRSERRSVGCRRCSSLEQVEARCHARQFPVSRQFPRWLRQ